MSHEALAVVFTVLFGMIAINTVVKLLKGIKVFLLDIIPTILAGLMGLIVPLAIAAMVLITLASSLLHIH